MVENSKQRAREGNQFYQRSSRLQDTREARRPLFSRLGTPLALQPGKSPFAPKLRQDQEGDGPTPAEDLMRGKEDEGTLVQCIIVKVEIQADTQNHDKHRKKEHEKSKTVEE